MSESPSLLQRFWEDLKRRHVVRVAVGYAVVAWALVEVADVLLPTFNAPDWLFRAIVAVAFLGFPVTVILTWVFDITDHQVVITETRGFRFPRWLKSLLAVPLIGLVGISGWWVWSGYVQEKESNLRPTELHGRVPVVAVMPIRNLTGDADLDWYGEGLANLIRDNLTRSRFLRVVSPLRFQAIAAAADGEVEIAKVSQEEGIGFILAGEMLTTPGGISVTSRLIDTEGGVALSARQLENLQPDALLSAAGPIAAQVRQSLNVPRAEQVDVFAADFATSNLAAYESYVAGLGFFLKFQYEQAARSFRAALELAPDFAVARYRLAYIQAVSGETGPAITNMKQALESTQLGDRERRYIEAGLALFRRDYEEAAGQYESLLEDYPFEVEARELLAKAYWGQYRAEDAVAEMERLATDEPQNEVIWSTLGSYLLSMGEFERARPALKRFAALAPDNPNAYTLLGDASRYEGDFDAARQQYDKALEIDPGMREVRTSLATIDYLQGRYAEAEAGFEEIAANVALSPRERLDAAFPLAALRAARGDFAGAAGTLAELSGALREEQIREAMALSERALYTAELGRQDEAERLAAEAIERSPGVPTRYLFARGLIELEGGRLDQALVTARDIAGHALPPDDPDRTEDKAAAYLRGRVALAKGELDIARTELAVAVETNGYAYRVYELSLARALLEADGWSVAVDLVAKSLVPDLVAPRIDLEPDRVSGILLEAELLTASGDPVAARQHAQRFLQRFSAADSSHPDILLAHDIVKQASTAAAR